MTKRIPYGRNPKGLVSSLSSPIAAKDGHVGTVQALATDVLRKALAHHRASQLMQADALYRRVLQLQPDNADAYQLLGLIAHQMGKHETAIQLFDRAIVANPRHAIAHNNRGVALRTLGRLEEALRSFNQAIRLRPDYAEAHANRGVALHDLRRYETAVVSYDKAIGYKPDFAQALNNRGNSLRELGRRAQALDDFERAIQSRPDLAEAHSNRGNLLQDLDRIPEALESYDRALALQPNLVEALSCRGAALYKLRRHQAALESIDRALELDPNYADAYINRGVVLAATARQQDALESYDRALEQQPNLVKALSHRGAALLGLHQYQAALESIDRALELDPNCADAYINRGVVLAATARQQDALESYDRALELDPNSVVSHYNRGTALNELKRYREALESYIRALRLDSDFRHLYGEYVSAKLSICDWDGLARDREVLTDHVQQGKVAVLPFHYLAMDGSPLLQRKAAEIHAQNECPAESFYTQPLRWPRHEKIRVGYFSPDFNDHPVSRLLAELFELHDRSQFELMGFSIGAQTGDDLEKRVAAAMDRFFDARLMTDEQVVQLAREHEVDIAVDLAGYTSNARPGVFARRAAPIQVNYLGFPGTMGAGFIDYLIADATLVPESSRKYYSEKIVYLPDCFQANDSKLQISDKPFSRAGQGLPEKGFVYCCFSNSNKITPEIFALWMRILKRVEDSVLWLVADCSDSGENLCAEAERCGVAAERLIFAGRLPYCEHLGRQRLADLFLDTLPFNAGATGSAALWAGLPILTCPGESFAGRMGASLLRAVRLPELIASSLDAYEEMAVELAQTPGLIAAFKERLRNNIKTAPLFDTPSYTRHLEGAYRQMHERHRAGLAPDHIVVGGISN